jgi:hypothetical protein
MGQVKYAIRRQCQITSDKSAYYFVKLVSQFSNRASCFPVQRPFTVYFSIFPVLMFSGLIPSFANFPDLPGLHLLRFLKIIFRNQNLFHPASPQKPFRIFSDHIRTLEIESADSQFSSSWNPIHSTSLSRLRFNKQINLIDLLSVTVLRLTNGARPTSLA